MHLGSASAGGGAHQQQYGAYNKQIPDIYYPQTAYAGSFQGLRYPPMRSQQQYVVKATSPPLFSEDMNYHFDNMNYRGTPGGVQAQQAHHQHTMQQQHQPNQNPDPYGKSINPKVREGIKSTTAQNEENEVYPQFAEKQLEEGQSMQTHQQQQQQRLRKEGEGVDSEELKAELEKEATHSQHASLFTMAGMSTLPNPSPISSRIENTAQNPATLTHAQKLIHPQLKQQIHPQTQNQSQAQSQNETKQSKMAAQSKETSRAQGLSMRNLVMGNDGNIAAALSVSPNPGSVGAVNTQYKSSNPVSALSPPNHPSFVSRHQMSNFAPFPTNPNFNIPIPRAMEGESRFNTQNSNVSLPLEVNNPNLIPNVLNPSLNMGNANENVNLALKQREEENNSNPFESKLQEASSENRFLTPLDEQVTQFLSFRLILVFRSYRIRKRVFMEYRRSIVVSISLRIKLLLSLKLALI